MSAGTAPRPARLPARAPVLSRRPRQAETPYADALEAHRDRLRTPLMIPGHAAGRWPGPDRLEAFLGRKALELDIPQLLPGIDLGLDSAFDRARGLAADAWGAETSWFLTNGASQGNRMALMALRERGDTVIMQRSSHSSVYDGLVMSGLAPRYVHPTIDPVHGIAHGVTPASVEAALDAAAREGRAVAAVTIVSPSYFGTVADVPGIAEVCHRAGVPLIVDASWGAHLGFHPELPESPTRQGADIVLSSIHKLGGSLTQSAILHLCGGRFAAELAFPLDRAFRLTESTSMSSLLLASLDIARSELATGSAAIAGSLSAAARLRRLLDDHPLLRRAEDDFVANADVVGLDPLHVPIDVRGLGRTGTEVKAALAQGPAAVFLEIATETSVVAIIGAGRVPDVDELVRALGEIPPARPARARGGDAALGLPRPGAVVLTPREAYLAPSEFVSRERAVGRVSADMLAAYPPGVPNIVPGERVTAAAIDYLTAVAHGPVGYVRGAVDPHLDRLRVCSEAPDGAR